jgi:hypothetical protein
MSWMNVCRWYVINMRCKSDECECDLQHKCVIIKAPVHLQGMVGAANLDSARISFVGSMKGELAQKLDRGKDAAGCWRLKSSAPQWPQNVSKQIWSRNQLQFVLLDSVLAFCRADRGVQLWNLFLLVVYFPGFAISQ